MANLKRLISKQEIIHLRLRDNLPLRCIAERAGLTIATVSYYLILATGSRGDRWVRPVILRAKCTRGECKRCTSKFCSCSCHIKEDSWT